MKVGGETKAEMGMTDGLFGKGANRCRRRGM